VEEWEVRGDGDDGQRLVLKYDYYNLGTATAGGLPWPAGVLGEGVASRRSPRHRLRPFALLRSITSTEIFSR